MLHIIIPGAPRSKKNSQEIHWVRGRPRIAQSALYRDYAKSCLKNLQQWGNVCFKNPVHVKCLYYVPDKRRRDLTNLLAATHDILEAAGIVENDSLIVNLDGSRIVGVDKENPRVEIEIWEE